MWCTQSQSESLSKSFQEEGVFLWNKRQTHLKIISGNVPGDFKVTLSDML